MTPNDALSAQWGDVIIPVAIWGNGESFPVAAAGTLTQTLQEMADLDLRVGHGHDTHRLARGRRLLLGGVAIEFDRGLVGHSDADVLLHAITDGLLGAAGLGDIGEWFSDTDPRWAGADSATLLATAVREIGQRKWAIVNVDCTISAEQPRLSPHKSAIRTRIAELLSIPAENVNVKAKTGEGVGPVGRQEAISADAVVLLMRP